MSDPLADYIAKNPPPGGLNTDQPPGDPLAAYMAKNPPPPGLDVDAPVAPPAAAAPGGGGAPAYAPM